MPNSTTNYSFNKPLVNDATDEDLWGGYLNDNWDSIDTELQSVSDTADSAGRLPVGSIYINATDNTNPGTLLGYGTWTAFGAGKVLVGLDSGDTDFDTAEETGGAKTHTLTTSEIPSHTHNTKQRTDVMTGGGSAALTGVTAPSGTTVATGSTGGGGAHNNLQPYIVCYFWKRTA